MRTTFSVSDCIRLVGQFSRALQLIGYISLYFRPFPHYRDGRHIWVIFIRLRLTNQKYSSVGNRVLLPYSLISYAMRIFCYESERATGVALL